MDEYRSFEVDIPISTGAAAMSSSPSCSSTGGITLRAGPPNLDKPPTRLLVDAAAE
jgi:hypothetical protein